MQSGFILLNHKNVQREYQIVKLLERERERETLYLAVSGIKEEGVKISSFEFGLKNTYIAV